MTNFLHHPAFQSLALPLLLALLATAVLRAASVDRWAPLGAALGLFGALSLLPGLDWPAASRAQKLPWVVLAGLVLAAVATAQRGAGQRPWPAWSGAVLCWAGASVWLAGVAGDVPGDGQGRILLPAAAFVAGAAVLALLAWGAPAASRQGPSAAASAAALTVAALGLAALAGGGGSLLLAQLALMLATCTAVLGLWAWLRPTTAAAGLQVTPAALMPLGLAWLALATAQVLASTATAPPGGAAAARLGLLALAFAVPPLLSRQRWAQAHPRWAPLAAALLAALPVAAAVAWQFGAAAGEPAGSDDDPYYTPG